VSRYQEGKTNVDFTVARDSGWQWHQLGHMQVRTLLQTDNHASTPPLSFLQAGCLSCHPTNSVRALKACTIVYKLHLLTYLTWEDSTTAADNTSVACYQVMLLTGCTRHISGAEA